MFTTNTRSSPFTFNKIIFAIHDSPCFLGRVLRPEFQSKPADLRPDS